MAKAPRTPRKTKGKRADPSKPPRQDRALAKQEAFVRQYLIHNNASKAYVEAGYSHGSGVHQSASNLLRTPYVQQRVAEERARAAKAADIDVDAVFKRFKDIAFSDIAAITSYEIGACRYCNGIDHAYQWRTPREYEDELAAAIRESDRTGKPAKLPTNEGGYGYSTNLAPHPDCPECDGRGIPRLVFKDTRLLTDEERAVFAGVEQTQTGLRYRFEDRMDALKQLAERINFFDASSKAKADYLAEAIAAISARGSKMPIRKDETQEGTT